MSEYERLRLQSCSRKRAFTRKRDAQRRADERGTEYRAYFCTFCAYYHYGRYGWTAEIIESQRPKGAQR